MVGMIVKNLLGSIMVLIGAVMAIPMVPGSGLVLVVAGILLLDFPGKDRTIRELLNGPAVLRPINGLRAVFGRAPLFIDCIG